MHSLLMRCCILQAVIKLRGSISSTHRIRTAVRQRLAASTVIVQGKCQTKITGESITIDSGLALSLCEDCGINCSIAPYIFASLIENLNPQEVLFEWNAVQMPNLVHTMCFCESECVNYLAQQPQPDYRRFTQYAGAILKARMIFRLIYPDV